MRIVWGILVVLLMIVGTDSDVPWIPWKIVIVMVGSLFMMLAKSANSKRREAEQVKRDQKAQELLDKIE